MVTTAGSVAAAGIRGASTLFGPIATLLSAMPMVFIPHAVRTGNSVGDQWRLVSRTSVATSVLTVVATGCLMAVPARVGAAILGASWPETLSVIPYIGVSAAAMCWALGVITVFQARGESRTVFGLSMLLVGLQLATSFAAGSIFRSAIAIAISLACSSLRNCDSRGAVGTPFHPRCRRAFLPIENDRLIGGAMLHVPDGVRTFRRDVRTYGLKWWSR